MAAVEAEQWAKGYPGEDADPASLRLMLMRGGRVSRTIPELRTQVAFENVQAYLLHDAAWLDAAVADPETDGELDPDKDAMWWNSDEGRAAINRKNKEAAERLAPRNLTQAGWGNE